MLRVAIFGLFMFSCSVPHRLGEHPADAFQLNDMAETVHISEAHKKNVHYKMLLRSHQSPENTPNPSALFAHRLEQTRSYEKIEPSTGLTVLTFSAGLDDAAHGRYPYVENRRQALADTIFGLADILYLQGVWRLEDADGLRTAAAQKGYVAYGGDASNQNKHGLMIFIRANVVDYSRPIVEDIYWYKTSRENSAALSWQLAHRQSGQYLLLMNTQVEQSLRRAHVRNQQAREIGLLLQDKQQEQIVIFGGDLASGPFYSSDIFEPTNGEQSEGWWVQGEAYALWLTYGGFRDVWNEIGIPKDVVLGEQWSQIPDVGTVQFSVYCGAVKPYLTVHDCNPGHRLTDFGMRYPTRAHHIFFIGSPSLVQVENVEVVLQDNIRLPGSIEAPLGIHSGVLANFDLAIK